MKPKSTEKQTQIIVRKVPETLRDAFKVKCAQDKISQQDKVIELIQSYVKS
jgi:hypothetical protein